MEIKIKKVEFKNAFGEWARFMSLLNKEMDSVANFPCDKEEDLDGLYWKRILKSPKEQYCLFLEIDGKIVGLLTYIGYKQYIDIRDFFIEQEYRNRGYGETLLNEVKKHKSGRIIYVGTVGGNERVLNLYKKFGFKILSYNMQMN